MQIEQKKLKALRNYFLKDGSTDQEDVMLQLGTDEESVMQAYVNELRLQFPDDFSPQEEEEEESTYTYFLKEETLITELELFRTKGDKLIFERKEPKEIVRIVLKQEDVKVDLVKLRKDPEGTTQGVGNAKLIEVAELAK